jgi:hypothetical protein
MVILYIYSICWRMKSVFYECQHCVRFLGNDGERVPDVHDGRTNLFFRYPSKANDIGYLRTSSQVHKGPDEEV